MISQGSSLLSPVKKKLRDEAGSSPANRPSNPAIVLPESPASVITISSDSSEEQEVAGRRQAADRRSDYGK